MNRKDIEIKKTLNEAKKIIKKENKNIKNISKIGKLKEFMRKILITKNRWKISDLSIIDECHNYKQSEIADNIIAVSTKEHHNFDNVYMQNPSEILTEANIERLEKHCKKAIHYERGEIKNEHEVTLCLLYRYLEQKEKINNQNKIINEMAEQLAGLTIWNNEKEEAIILGNKGEVKQYFEKKVEEK